MALMTAPSAHHRPHALLVRLAVCLGLGLVVGALSVPRFGAIEGGVAAWIAAAGVFTAWTWAVIGRMPGEQAQAHATWEYSNRAVIDGILLVGSVASLVGVGLLLFRASGTGSGPPWEALAGVLCVVASWLLVHTIFTLRYAALYYRGTPGGIDFNQSELPDYRDFAYLAFSIGMTYQVSDTNLQNSQIRRAALAHSLLSYLFGSVVLATTINLVVQLAGSGGAASSGGGGS